MTEAVTINQFRALNNSEKPYLEFWRGAVVKQKFGTIVHSLLFNVLMRHLDQHGMMALPKVTLRLGDEAELIPDLSVLSCRPSGDYPTGDVLLAIEILRPDESLEWLKDKCRYYIAKGVEHAWILDPQTKAAWTFGKDAPQGAALTGQASLSARDAVLHLGQVFDELQAQLGPKQAQ